MTAIDIDDNMLALLTKKIFTYIMMPNFVRHLTVELMLFHFVPRYQ